MDERRERRRQDILVAAKRAFARHGYHATNIADIAKSLGIGHGTFYRYFENKLDIFSAVIDGVVTLLTAAIVDEHADAAHDADAYRSQVTRIGRKLHGVFVNDPDVARLLFVESVGVDDAITARLAAAGQFLASVTEGYLENGVRCGFLRADLDVEVTALLLNAMILEGARLQVLGAGMNEAALERFLAAATAMIFEGIVSPGSDAT